MGAKGGHQGKGRGGFDGRFRPGYDPRRRRGFTPAECRKGYQAAIDAAWNGDGHLLRWLDSRVRGWYRAARAGRPFDWTPAARRARQVGSPPIKESVQ